MHMMEAGYLAFDVYPVYFDPIACVDDRVRRMGVS
jgi:hypothetical protein